ncbi:LysM peptidoglycan-binding domain-containing protein [Bacillus sp. BRMEA1]|uniref:LysM peptidoglycan-binding domain-containing protein n=1 Tax=Neobacillus endophyticus TaxID=2738405 RepID=UPI001566C3D7|nr:LysM peptidoglycan-binding domain-containing protein [Neobacillus endophyticus]NRD76929.1 LysM peptidoglycan-binding domain-containing protein [Neobacillus endophyticus]
MKQLKKIKKAIATTAISLSILTPATMMTANAATITYTVKSGDTLSAIANKYNVSLTSLESANKMTNSSVINVGQVLTIPSTSTTTTATNITSSTVTYTVYTGTTAITAATSLYASPSTSAKIVKALPKGSKWKIYGYRSDGWYNLGPGWVKASCTSTSITSKGATTVVSAGTPTMDTKTTTTTSSNTTTSKTVTYTVYTGTAAITAATSLYASPSTSAKIVKALPKGSKWKIYGYRSDGWYNLGAGWVKASCTSTSITSKGATTVVSSGTTTSTTTSATKTTTTATTSTTGTASTTSTTTTTTTTYTVASGDTASKIASKYGLTLAQFQALNPQISNLNLLYVGEVVNIKQAATISMPTTTPSSAPAGTPVPPAPAAGQMIYKVLSGDTATAIANKYNMTLAELQQINPQVTNWNTLAAMQQILVYTPSAAVSDTVVTTNVTSNMKSAFIAEVAPAAIQAWQTNRILPSLTIAQAILESYWGESYLSVNAQNYFGIKASLSWAGSTITLPTQEYDANGNLYVVNAAFRAYSNIFDSINDHTQLLMASRYSNLIGVTDYKVATTLIQQDGYATDPNYTNLLQSVITTNNLTQYDVQAGAIPASN